MIETKRPTDFLDLILLILAALIFLSDDKLFGDDTGVILAGFPVFFFAGCYWLIDLLPKVKHTEAAHFYKLGIIIALTTILSVGPLMANIQARRDISSQLYANDNPIQVEAAIAFLLAGKNPYQENYLNTPLKHWYYEKWGKQINPALYHLIVLPAHLVLSLPFYIVSHTWLGWYDQRVVYFLAWLILLLVAYNLTGDNLNRRIGLILLALNPVATTFLALGYNDVFPLALLAIAVLMAKQRRWLWVWLSLGLAASIKHTAWFILPFFLYYYWLASAAADRVKKSIQAGLVVASVVGIFTLPFLIWNETAFIEDIYHYPAGDLPTSYPISGLGISMVLYKMGMIGSPFDYFPFWIWQTLVGIPLLFFLLHWQKKNNILTAVLVNYALFLLVFLYFSRFLHENYLAFITQILVLAYLVYQSPPPDNNVLTQTDARPVVTL